MFSFFLFMDTDHNYYTRQSAYHNKSTSVQKMYHYEGFILGDSIFPTIHFYTGNYSHNGARAKEFL